MPLGLPVLTFLVAVSYVPGLPSNAYVGRWSVVLVGAALLLWTVRLEPGRAHRMGAALLIWAMWASAWTVSIWEHAYGLLHLVSMAAVFCVAHAYRGPTDPIWRALALGVTVSAGFSIAQAIGYQPVWSLLTIGSTGLYLTKNMAADAAVLALIGAAGLVVRQGWRSAAYLLPGPAVTFYLVHSRAAALALYVAVLAAVMITARPRARFLLAYTWVAITGAAAWAAWDHLGAFNDRWSIWTLVARNINLWGDGLESLAVAAPHIEYAHNEVIQFAFELGAPSLLLWGVAAHALTGQRAHTHVTERAALLALLASSMFWFTLHTPLGAYMAALLAGYLSGCRDRAGRAQLPGGAEGGASPRPRTHGPGGASVPAGVRRPHLPSGPQHPVVA